MVKEVFPRTVLSIEFEAIGFVEFQFGLFESKLSKLLGCVFSYRKEGEDPSEIWDMLGERADA
jgi:hypothetical protein